MKQNSIIVAKAAHSRPSVVRNHRRAEFGVGAGVSKSVIFPEFREVFGLISNQGRLNPN